MLPSFASLLLSLPTPEPYRSSLEMKKSAAVLLIYLIRPCLAWSVQESFVVGRGLPRHSQAAPHEEIILTTAVGTNPLAVDRKSAVGLLLLAALAPALPASAKSYSANARNLERLNAGDASGGTLYDNNPSTEASRKRRAMTGCKIASARQQAGVISEKDCNMKVLAGETEFMLQALRELDCPTCPYGVASK